MQQSSIFAAVHTSPISIYFLLVSFLQISQILPGVRVPPALQALAAQLPNPAWCAGAACVAGPQILPGVRVPPALQALSAQLSS